MKKSKKEGVGAIWVKEKVKFTKTGKKLLIKYLSIKIGDNYYVAFSSGKKSDKNQNYPDLIIYNSKRQNKHNMNNDNSQDEKIYDYNEVINDITDDNYNEEIEDIDNF